MHKQIINQYPQIHQEQIILTLGMSFCVHLPQCFWGFFGVVGSPANRSTDAGSKQWFCHAFSTGHRVKSLFAARISWKWLIKNTINRFILKCISYTLYSITSWYIVKGILVFQWIQSLCQWQHNFEILGGFEEPLRKRAKIKERKENSTKVAKLSTR